MYIIYIQLNYLYSSVQRTVGKSLFTIFYSREMYSFVEFTLADIRLNRKREVHATLFNPLLAVPMLNKT